MNLGGHERKGPSTAELQRFIREQVQLEFLLSNGERLTGKLKWFDDQAFAVLSANDDQITILRSAIMAYRINPK